MKAIYFMEKEGMKYAVYNFTKRHDAGNEGS